jgi:II/X family phage/plasmid replication protein
VLDTVKIRSPFIDEATARAAEHHGKLQRRTCTDLSTGEILWEFTRGPLTGTWDHRISVEVMRHEWVVPGHRSTVEQRLADPYRDRAVREHKQRRERPIKVPCAPYLLVEASVHKALLGHNLYGGPVDLQAPVTWFVDELGRQLGVELPPASAWTFRRIDWAEVFDLGSFGAAEEYVRYWYNASFPRRQVHRYGGPAGSARTVMFPGTTTTVKLYHKGPEFEEHDRKRLLQVGKRADRLDQVTELVNRLQDRANMLVRCEVETHARTLDDKYAIAPGPVVEQSEIVQWVQSLHDHEMARVLREGTSAVLTVRMSAAVRRRLDDVYGGSLARTLYGTWLEFSAMGEASVRSHLPVRTFYRHRKLLAEAGCSWQGSDVKLDEERPRLVPEDFSPIRTDPRRLVGEAPEVALMLAPYREVA